MSIIAKRKQNSRIISLVSTEVWKSEVIWPRSSRSFNNYFFEQLPCAKHCFRRWGYTGKQNSNTRSVHAAYAVESLSAGAGQSQDSNQ